MNLHEGMVMKKAGRMMVVRDGELVTMDEEVLMNDGTRVLTNGTVIRTDGTTRMMMEGESMGMDGAITDREFQEEMEDMENKDDM
ncbi:MAG TPA: DUF6799 domain-containing protein [Anaerolineales bacterium]|nr:DUF6799 domain-containing protein [Anaerolineales bacterium]